MHSVIVQDSAIQAETEKDALVLFQDLQGSALLLMGSSSFQAIVSRFSDGAMRAHARATLTRLRDRNRMVSCINPALQYCPIETHLCDTEQSATSAIISNNRPCSYNGQWASLPTYIMSELRQELLQQDFSFLKPTTQGAWEERLWRPLFRHARAITIVDYYAGRNPFGFIPSLEWIEQQATTQSGRAIAPALYTSVEGDDSAEIRAFCRGHGWQLHLRVYDANSGDSLPHERYIITDQFGIQIGRGLNLLSGCTEDVRDSAIHICRQPGTVVSKAHRAPELD